MASLPSATCSTAKPPACSTVVPLGYDILASRPAELGAQIRAEVAKWRKVVKEAGIKVE